MKYRPKNLLHLLLHNRACSSVRSLARRTVPKIHRCSLIPPVWKTQDLVDGWFITHIRLVGFLVFPKNRGNNPKMQGVYIGKPC